MSESTSCPSEIPFFIVGNPRSGTTLLTFILSSHPRLHIPGETGFLPRLTGYTPGNLSEEQVRELIQIITHLNREWDGLVKDEGKFYSALPSKTLACVLDGLYRLRTKDYKADRWGDKTPSYVRYIPQIDQIFPSAKFIHIIRDGRDSTLSAQKKWGRQRWYMDNYYLLKNWAANVETGRRAGGKLGPNRYLEIRYENLVQRPRETIESVCAFLEEEFHPNMLEHSKLAQKMIGPTGHTEALRPINTQSVERWKQEMTAFDKKAANALIGKTLKKYGYPLAAEEPLTRQEKIKLFLTGVRYRLLTFVRSVLYKTGLLTLNRGKRP